MLMNRFMLGGSVSVIDLVVALLAAPLAAVLARQLEAVIANAQRGDRAEFAQRWLPRWLRELLRFPTHAHLIIASKVIEDEKHYFVNCCPRTKAITRHLMAMDTPMHARLIGQHCSAFGNYWSSNLEATPTYMIDDVAHWTVIAPNVSFRCRSTVAINNTGGNDSRRSVSEQPSSQMAVRRYFYELQSAKLNTAALVDWVDELTERVAEELKAKERAKGNRYHFIYRGHRQNKSSSGINGDSNGGGGGGGSSSNRGAANDDPGEPQFTMSVLSSKTVECFDTLDRLFHPHVGRLKRDLAQLRDLAFFRRHGGKRKRGYLMSGPPGTCKTATAAAVAADDGRHILEVPWSRLQTNAQLEDVLNTRLIGGVHFEARELLVLFEEIDRGHEMFGNKDGKDCAAVKDTPAPTPASTPAAAVAAAPSEATSTAAMVTAVTTAMLTAAPLKPIFDELNMGVALSRLDGVTNYDGLLIFANTNNADGLPESMKREGRLTHLVFGPMDSGDARRMVADFYSEESAQQQQGEEDRKRELLLDEVGALVDGAWLVGARLSGMCARNETLAGMVTELRAAVAAKAAADAAAAAAAAAADAAAAAAATAAAPEEVATAQAVPASPATTKETAAD